MLTELGQSEPQLKSNVDLMRELLGLDDNVVTLNGNPFFETNVDEWSSDDSGVLTRSTDVSHEGVASALFEPGGAASVEIRITDAAAPAVVETQSYQFSAWVFHPFGWDQTRLVISWRDDVGGEVSATAGTITVIEAGLWTWLNLTATAPSLAVKARPSVRMQNTPAATDKMYVDEAIFADGLGFQTLFRSDVAGVSSAIAYHRFLIDVRDR